jgi:hypothetical protein
MGIEMGMETGRRTRRGAAVPVVFVVVAALVLSLVACGSDGGSGGAASGSAVPVGTRLPTTLDLVATDYTFTNESGAVAAGPVTVRLRNDGNEPHQVQLGRTRGDVTPEQFMDVFHTQGELAALQMLDWSGGVNAIAPGTTGEATSVLESGSYLMVCFVPDAQGVSHIDHRMVSSLDVGPKGDATEPVADQRVTLADYSVTMPTGFTGHDTYEVTNDGQEPHELILLRLKDGKTFEDLAAYAAGGNKGEAPYDFAGGVSALQPGASAWTPLDLAAGSYVALCVITSPTTMQQHVQMGMVTPFTVS